MKKQFVLSLVLLLALAVPVIAQVNLGARPMGMGGAFVGLADDANAIFSNPAGIAYQARESTLMSTRVSEGREYTMIGGVQITPVGNIGIGYVGSTDPVSGSIDLASDSSGDSPVKYTTQTLYLTYAQELNNVMNVPDNMGKLSLGLNVKFASRKLATANGLSQDGGSDVDLDLASVFKVNDSLALGGTVSNFVSGATQDIPNLTTVEDRKFGYALGASGRLFSDSITWSVDSNEIGCEWQVVKGFALRAGRNSDGVTSGLGISINGFGIDYAYQQKVQYWSVSLVPQDDHQAETKQASVPMQVF